MGRGTTSARALARVLKSAAAVAYAATDVDDAFKWGLDLVCAYTGWPVGHIYRVDRETGEALPTPFWHLEDAVAYEPFVRVTELTPLPPGTGLPGRIVATGEPAWIDDVRADPNFPRAAVAVECALGAAFGFPIPSSRGIEAVMEFFAAEPAAPDEELLDLISHVGTLLGGVLDRVRSEQQRELAEEARDESEAQLVAAQRIARIGSWSWRVGENSVVWSAQLHRIYGVDQGAGPVAFEDYLAKVHPDDRDRVMGAVEQSLATLEPYEHEYRILHPDGVRWVHARGEVIVRDGAVPIQLGGYCQDVTERRLAEERGRRARLDLATEQRVLERIARGDRVRDTLDVICQDIESRYPDAQCSVLLVSPDGDVLRHAAAPSLPTGFTDSIDGLPIGEGMAACGTAAHRRTVVIVEDALTDPLTAVYVDLARAYDIKSVWSQPLVSPGGEVLGTFALYRHERHRPGAAELRTVAVAGHLAMLALERDRAERALSAAASVDPLTGLPNRARFLEELGRSLDRPGEGLAVMFLDLDRFKWINDSLGHPAGDLVLVEVAARLRDVLDSRHMLARFGGDEFTVLVTDQATDIDEVADRIESAFAEPFVLDGGEFFLTVSIGIALNDLSADGFALVRDADAAMYAAKERGRARRARFDEQLRRRAIDRVRLESDLRRAIERDEFVMYYQPILDIRTGRWSGAEALVRWRHPRGDIVGPDTFVPLAEETGLIVPLGLRILDRVAAEVATWISDGADFVIATNVSVLQLTDPSFARELAECLGRNHLEPERLSIEVTESAVMDRIDDARAALDAIAMDGVSILVDDFGTGHSSIARLRELPVAGVKIDRRFVTPLGTDPSADRVLAAMTELAHALGLTVVAEGVETAAGLAKIAALGCDRGQGYHLARPVPGSDARRLLGH